MQAFSCLRSSVTRNTTTHFPKAKILLHVGGQQGYYSVIIARQQEAAESIHAAETNVLH